MGTLCDFCHPDFPSIHFRREVAKVILLANGYLKHCHGVAKGGHICGHKRWLAVQ